MRLRARRLLNPFRGVLQTIETENLDAASIDGNRWGLYISDPSIYQFIDRNSVVPFHSTDVKYGDWTEQEGLSRAPLLPSMDQDKLRQRGDELVAIVQTHSSQVPFELQDHYERWLLDDENGRPVALLESAFDLADVKYNSNTLWRIGNSAQDEIAFDEPGQSPTENAGKTLQDMINRRCKQGRTLWVRRGAQGEGEPIYRGEQGKGEEKLMSQDVFPPLGLRSDWEDPLLSRLSEKYLHWLSPWLLLLPSASRDREGIVRQAIQYPKRLYQIRRLLTAELTARKDIKAALVQAKLSRSA